MHNWDAKQDDAKWLIPSFALNVCLCTFVYV